MQHIFRKYLYSYNVYYIYIYIHACVCIYIYIYNKNTQYTHILCKQKLILSVINCLTALICIFKYSYLKYLVVIEVNSKS